MLELIIYTLVIFIAVKLCNFFMRIEKINSLHKDIDSLYYLIVSNQINRELGNRVLNDLEAELEALEKK